MAKKKNKPKDEKNLSKQAIEAIEHFCCYPPKYFSRNLRCLIVDWMERNNDGMTFFQEELFSELTLFFRVQAFIERRFQEYFHLRFDEKRWRYTLAQLLNEFRKTGFIDDYFVEKIDMIRLKRNPFVYLRDPLHNNTLMARSFEIRTSPYKLLEDDAKDALRLMLMITKMRVL